MAELRQLMTGLGARDVTTWGQSGNLIFKTKEEEGQVAGRKIGRAVAERCGFEPAVLVLSTDRLTAAVASMPFPEADAEPKSVHVYFLASTPPAPDIMKLESIRSDSERFVLDGEHFYLHAPDGIARSRLATGAEKALGVTATARNWRTVCKIHELVRETG